MATKKIIRKRAARKLTAKRQATKKQLAVYRQTLLDGPSLVEFLSPDVVGVTFHATTGRAVKSAPFTSPLGDDRIEAAVRAVVEGN